uniref:50S ribosomal protein L14 n=1 Tax=Nephromyces sp. ex Molgula occidentalis TaxID=2544991 RepID=A0A5C1H8H2_9APIC|nr:50S ribosomal protein L14 [Nephromyces sp. ex Molgula occidentalis]
MIQIGSTFNIIDNTGVKTILCIDILKSKINKIKIEDIIIGVVKNWKKNKLFKKSMIIKALVLRWKKSNLFKTGLSYKFNDNAAILIDNNKNPLGTRILGPIPKLFKDKNYIKIISLVSDFI